MHFRSSLGQFPNCHIISLNVGDGTKIWYKRGFNAIFFHISSNRRFREKDKSLFSVLEAISEIQFSLFIACHVLSFQCFDVYLKTPSYKYRTV